MADDLVRIRWKDVTQRTPVRRSALTSAGENANIPYFSAIGYLPPYGLYLDTSTSPSKNGSSVGGLARRVDCLAERVQEWLRTILHHHDIGIRTHPGPAAGRQQRADPVDDADPMIAGIHP